MFEKRGEGRSIEPVKVINDFNYSFDHNVYSPPFASEKEANSELVGSEKVVLCSKTEALFSTRFVQCVGALVRNNETGLVSVIHESLWSTAATSILALQHGQDLDVILLEDGNGNRFRENVRFNHENPPRGLMENVANSVGPFLGLAPDSNFPMIRFGDRSIIKGMSSDEAVDILSRGVTRSGKTNFVGMIRIPNVQNRLWLLYRPGENIIYVYDDGDHRLFQFGGFKSS